MIDKKDIRQLSFFEIQDYFLDIDEPRFRAKQVYEWLWKKRATSFDEMTNLSFALREKLNENFKIPHLKISNFQQSKDGTIKTAFKLSDNRFVEGVIIPVLEDKRITACISSQVGCSLSCKFCATGFLKRERNLLPHEIYDQVYTLNQLCLEKFDNPLTNVVFMGMGEPLLNYKNVLEGIEKISSDEGMNFSAKRITVSTAGIAKMITKLADNNVRFNLALSLHAANDDKRDKIMPINEQNNLEALSQSLNHFINRSRNKLTYEYILLSEFNDTEQDAIELATFCKKNPAMVNIIEYNAVEGVEFKRANKNRLNKFVKKLVDLNVNVTVRKSRGEDIDAACGQLANKLE